MTQKRFYQGPIQQLDQFG